MSETWKGKTRGGIFGYMFFIYMIRCLGITAAYGFLALVVLYFIPFAPKATGNTWSYARNRLKRTAEIRRTAPEKLLPAGTNID